MRLALAAALTAGASPASPQALRFNTGINVTGTASTNPDLAPRGQEVSDMWLTISPYFTLTSTTDGKFRVSGAGTLGASARLSLRGQDSFSTYLRPSGNLNGTWEAVDNFFFVDVGANVQSTLNDPFLATTDPTSPVNTSTSYQLNLTPYIRGQLGGNIDYEVRSANSWTDSPNSRGQYSANNIASFQRPATPLGGAFVFQQQLISSSVEGQSLLSTETARFSLRYALTSALTLGARIGAERYNYTITARQWQRFYGAEIGWRPNERTSLEGYWEDRVFGNSWQLSFNYRRPQSAINVTSSRLLSSTPQQFLTFPGLSNLVSLLDAAFTTRIPDPVQRQRAIVDFLSQTQLPQELLTPSIIYTENFTIQETNAANFVLNGKRDSLAFNVFWTSTQSSVGISSALPVGAKTRQKGSQLVLTRQMSPITSVSASASWRNTENQLDTNQQTTQTQLLLTSNVQVGRRTTATFGARYQWISSTVTNDATEAALFCTLNYSFN